MLIGRLTSDPIVYEARKEGGKPVTTFSIALNRNWKNSEGILVEKTDFQKVVAFGKLGEIVAKYLKKGKPVLVAGRLQANSYQAQDGSKRYVTEVVMEDFNFMDSAPVKNGDTDAVDAATGEVREAVAA